MATVLEEKKSVTGGTIRLMAVPAKTPQEIHRQREATMRVCMQVLANTVEALGVEETLNRMTNGPHAYLLEGRL